MENEMVKLIKEHYGKTGDDTSEAFTEGLDYVQEEVCNVPSPSQWCPSHYYGQLKHLDIKMIESIPVGCQPSTCWPYVLFHNEQVWTCPVGRGWGSCIGWGRGRGPIQRGTSLWTDRMTDRHDWKHYLPATSLAGGNKKACVCVLNNTTWYETVGHCLMTRRH